MLPHSFHQTEDGVDGEEVRKSYELEELLATKGAQADDSSPRWRLISFFVRRSVFQLAILLLPSFIQSRIRPATAKPRKVNHPTAFLDGMRGIAALLVFIDHLSYSSHDVHTAWGAGEPGQHREFLRLPFVRFFYNGGAMVSIFYIVSGYALSYKPVRQMRAHDWPNLMHTISSSVFRRALRLYLPCLASTFLIVLLVRTGIYEWTRSIADDRDRLPYIHEIHLQRFDNSSEQFWDWAYKMWYIFDPFSFGTMDRMIDIDGHLWTIPMEFRSSLILYLTQAGLARMKPLLRLASLVALIIFCLFKDRWEMVLFYFGFFFAEVDFTRNSIASNNALVPDSMLGFLPILPQSKRLRNGFWLVVFLAGIYLGGQPAQKGEEGAGWATLTALIPLFISQKARFWCSWGAVLLVWSTCNAPFLQLIFNNGPVQYLGNISFALYLVHGMCNHTVAYGIMDISWRLFGRDTAFRKEMGFCIAAAVNIMVVICVADLFWRVVDIPVVRFTKWLEDRCIIKVD